MSTTNNQLAHITTRLLNTTRSAICSLQQKVAAATSVFCSVTEWTDSESRLFRSILVALEDQKINATLLLSLQTDAECLLERRKTALHAVPYKMVSVNNLEWFACCALLLAIIKLRQAYNVIIIHKQQGTLVQEHSNDINTYLKQSIEILDAGLIMAGGLSVEQHVHELIKTAEELFAWMSNNSDDRASKSTMEGEIHTKRRRLTATWESTLESLLNPQQTASIVPPLSTLNLPLNEIERITAPSFNEYQRLVAKQIPFIIAHDDGVQQWPAMTRWRSTDYLLKVLGHRWVPVEIGQRYTDTQWQQQLMPFAAFLRDYVAVTLTADRAVGYLAQHDLFRQVPELRRDIQIPDYCFVASTSTNTVQTHAWFGPAGTTSPLHYDPDHNLFAQVVGRKQFRLYAPDQPVYPHASDTMLHNTSQVDVEQPQLDKFPEFAHAQGYDCILQPGDLLYIPPLWWHYVRALDTSFSVSFWF